MEMRPLTRASITPEQLHELTDLVNLIDPEQRPGDPPLPPEYVADQLDVESSFRWLATWGVWNVDQLVGLAQLEATVGVEDAEACDVIFGVHPDHRRQGLGRQIFDQLVAIAGSDGRTIVHPWLELTSSSRAFFADAGFDLAMDERISRLDVAAVDPELMQSWIDQSSQRAQGYHLERWIGRCPDELAEQYVDAITGMNEAPNEGLTVEPRSYTVARIRDREAVFRWQGHLHYVIMAVETATGRAAGYTGAHILKHHRSHSYQGDTTTLLDHRERGLGRWMKAAMWQWLRAEEPEVRFLLTGNADSNAAMLAINIAMGFTPELHFGCWEHPDVKELAASTA